MNLSRGILLSILATQTLVLGAAFWGFSRELEESNLEREARVFHVTTNLQYSQLLSNPENSASQAMLGTARHISQMAGLIGVCLFDDVGNAVLCVPENLPTGELQNLGPDPEAHLREDFPFNKLSGGSTEADSPPVLQLDIPLLGLRGQPVAFIRFFREASLFSENVHRQKRNLFFLCILAIVLAAGITSVVFLVNDRKIRRTEAILRAKNEELLNTQRHLLLSSQMNAVGSMTAHLIHDIKSYSSRISRCLTARKQGPPSEEREWEQAGELAAEMDKHIRDFLTFLRNNDSEFQSIYSTTELLEILRRKLAKVAEKGEVDLISRNHAKGMKIDFMKGNFLILILQNLLHNAIEATPRGGSVRLEMSGEEEITTFRVADGGPGIPEKEQGTLFTPKHSFKQGGTGLGLAICTQMAYHIGARISLESTGPGGSIFKVSLPLSSEPIPEAPARQD